MHVLTLNAWGALADLILAAHAAVVAFVVFGQLLVMIGGWRHWQWVRNPVLRYAHLALIVFIAVEAWLGQMCPLTTLEQSLRVRAGQTQYDQSFLGYWLSHLIFFDLPAWVFTVLHTSFAALVAATFVMVPPRSSRHQQPPDL